MEWVPDALSALEENSPGKTHEAPWAVMAPCDPDIKQAIEIPRRRAWQVEGLTGEREREAP